MSSSAVVTISVNPGNLVCRPAGWIDVVKFFLLNYGLHAFTVVSRPGSTTFPTVVNVLAALVLPFSSIVTAFDMIRRFPLGQSGALKTAHKAGALCMILPKDLDARLHPISSQITKVHGQYPLHNSIPFFKSMGGFFRRLFGIYRESEQKSDYQLVFVSSLLNVKPLGEVHSGSLDLACNYSFVKAAAAISQILYATFELYQARGRQLEKFGYAAYSLTVIPYILMSLTNLLATAFGPQYPSMFIVLYRGTESSSCGVQEQEPKTWEGEPEQIISQKRGREQVAPGQQKHAETMKISSIVTVGREKGVSQQNMFTLEAGWRKDFETSIISGAIGEAYGPLESEVLGQEYALKLLGLDQRLALMRLVLKHVYWMKYKYQAFVRDATRTKYIWYIFLWLAFMCTVAAPYVIIHFLTGFRYGQSSSSQRGWVMAWLVIGQFYGITITSVPAALPFLDSILIHWLKLLYTLLLSVVTVGGFVIVARMILEDEICTLV